MKKTIIITSLVCGFGILTAFNSKSLITKQKDYSISFCEGWEAGYKDALDGCLKAGVAPVCPTPPIGKDSYKHGYGMGYAKAQIVCNNNN